MKVYKYATGQEVPSNGTYLHTRIEKTKDGIEFVWHYFLVES
jgi:hypothetical protein